jgi:hypothetical protein
LFYFIIFLNWHLFNFPAQRGGEPESTAVSRGASEQQQFGEEKSQAARGQTLPQNVEGMEWQVSNGSSFFTYLPVPSVNQFEENRQGYCMLFIPIPDRIETVVLVWYRYLL